MTQRKVLLDANVIIECFRIGAWAELAQGCWLETVEECYKEALTGDSSLPGRIAVDPIELQKGLRQIHKVTRAERNQLFIKHPSMVSLDPGELDLYAHLLAVGVPQPNLVVISTADKGAIVRAGDLNWLDQLHALEELLTQVGASRPKMAALKGHYTTMWLSDVRMKVRMGIIP